MFLLRLLVWTRLQIFQILRILRRSDLSAGWVDPGALNFAALTRLRPNTRYYYVVGDLVSSCTLHKAVTPV